MAKKASNATKRIVLMSDLHCGHMCGLTPPPWQIKPHPESGHYRHKLAAAQCEAWDWYEKAVKEVRPVHAVLVVGDAIDGRGEKSGSTELITTDRNEQATMAVHAIDQFKAKRHQFVYGTAYHTGQLEDFEDNIAGKFGAKIGAHEWVDINGVVIDMKHHIGSSAIPHERRTALERAALWNRLWADEELQPRADIIVRGHVHYYGYSGERSLGRRRERMTLPALQTMGTKFGARICEGLVHCGFIVIDVKPDGTWQKCDDYVAELKAHKATVSKL